MNSFDTKVLIGKIVERIRPDSLDVVIPLGGIIRDYEKAVSHHDHQSIEIMRKLGARLKALETMKRQAIENDADEEVREKIEETRKESEQLMSEAAAIQKNSSRIRAVLEASASKHQFITIVHLHVGRALWFWRGRGNVSLAAKHAVGEAIHPSSDNLSFIVIVFRAPTVGQLARVERVKPRSFTLVPSIERSTFSSAELYWAQVEENLDNFAAELTGAFPLIPMDPALDALIAAPSGLRVVRRSGAIARIRQAENCVETRLSFDQGAGPARGIKIAVVDRVDSFVRK